MEGVDSGHAKLLKDGSAGDEERGPKLPDL
jgi:hypothetical protein